MTGQDKAAAVNYRPQRFVASGDDVDFYAAAHGPKRQPGGRQPLLLSPQERQAVATALLREIERSAWSAEDEVDYCQALRGVLGKMARR